MLKRVLFVSGLLTASVFLLLTCAPPPEIQPETEAPPPPPPSSEKFVMKPFHWSMISHMELSYDISNEILLGVYEGSRQDPKRGRIYYFSDFTTFDKTTLSWGPIMNVMAEVSSQELEPEILSKREFKDILEWDKIGICWDIDEDQVRHTYLVEGQKMLLFLELRYDEANNRSERRLIDAYPSTKTCTAEDVFNLMVGNMVAENPL